eukprot:gene7553-9832_t
MTNRTKVPAVHTSHHAAIIDYGCNPAQNSHVHTAVSKMRISSNFMRE